MAFSSKIFLKEDLFQVFMQAIELEPVYLILRLSNSFCSLPLSPSKPCNAINTKSYSAKDCRFLISLKSFNDDSSPISNKL